MESEKHFHLLGRIETHVMKNTCVLYALVHQTHVGAAARGEDHDEMVDIAPTYHP